MKLIYVFVSGIVDVGLSAISQSIILNSYIYESYGTQLNSTQLSSEWYVKCYSSFNCWLIHRWCIEWRHHHVYIICEVITSEVIPLKIFMALPTKFIWYNVLLACLEYSFIFSPNFHSILCKSVCVCHEIVMNIMKIFEQNQ